FGELGRRRRAAIVADLQQPLSGPQAVTERVLRLQVCNEPLDAITLQRALLWLEHLACIRVELLVTLDQDVAPVARQYVEQPFAHAANLGDGCHFAVGETLQLNRGALPVDRRYLRGR